MTKRRAAVVGLPVLAVGIAAALLWPPPVRPVTISITAPAGTKVTGSYEADGVTSAIDAEAPAEIAINARAVSFSVRKDDRPGEMVVRIAVEGHGYASAGAGAGGTVRGGYKSGPGIARTERFWATNSAANP